jgi:hypothetical protein
MKIFNWFKKKKIDFNPYKITKFFPFDAAMFETDENNIWYNVYTQKECFRKELNEAYKDEHFSKKEIEFMKDYRSIKTSYHSDLVKKFNNEIEYGY